MWNPGRGRWTGLRRHGPNWTVGPTPAGPNRITEDVKLQVPARVPKYQSDRSADPRLNPQQIRKHQRRDDNSRDPVRTSSSRRAVTKTEVCLGRLTNPKSFPVHVDPHAPGIRASEYATRQYERTEWSRTDKSRVQFLQCGKRRERDEIFLFSSQDL